MAKIPEPFKIMYRPPEGEYQNLPDVLDTLHHRINMLESQSQENE